MNKMWNLRFIFVAFKLNACCDIHNDETYKNDELWSRQVRRKKTVLQNMEINTKILDLFLFSFQMQTAAMTHIMPEIMKSNNDELRDIIDYFLIY